MSDMPTEPTPTIAYEVADFNAVDGSHLSALSVCHFIWGALLAFFSCIGIFYVVLGFVMLSGRLPPRPASPQPVDEHFLGVMFIVIGVVLLLFGWALAGCTIASGVMIRRRRRRVFSIVIAGINCAIFPFGTTLGVFTLMVLLRDSVRRIYESRPT